MLSELVVSLPLQVPKLLWHLYFSFHDGFLTLPLTPSLPVHCPWGPRDQQALFPRLFWGQTAYLLPFSLSFTLCSEPLPKAKIFPGRSGPLVWSPCLLVGCQESLAIVALLWPPEPHNCLICPHLMYTCVHAHVDTYRHIHINQTGLPAFLWTPPCLLGASFAWKRCLGGACAVPRCLVCAVGVWGATRFLPPLWASRSPLLDALSPFLLCGFVLVLLLALLWHHLVSCLLLFWGEFTEHILCAKHRAGVKEKDLHLGVLIKSVNSSLGEWLPRLRLSYQLFKMGGVRTGFCSKWSNGCEMSCLELGG